MSLRSPQLARLALVASLIAPVCLTGCSSVGKTVQGWWPWGDEKQSARAPAAQARNAAASDSESVAGQGSSQEATAPLAEPAPLPGDEPILTYWETIYGGLVGSSGAGGKILDVVTGGEFVALSRPTAIAMRDNWLYVVDMGLEMVVRIDRVSQRVERLLELKGVTKDEVADIYVAADRSFYLADTFGSRVLHFNANGRLLRSFQNKLNLVRPVAIGENQTTGEILVADSEFDHVLLFGADGTLLAAVGGRGNEPGQFLNVTAMARGPDGFYVGARVGQRIQALSPAGDYLYSFPQGTVVFPMAMAADDDFRVFVGDYMDNSIKVYERGRFVASIGHTGVEPGLFKRITDLWVDRGFLYVADSLNSRIQVLRIAEAAPAVAEP